MKNLLLKMTLLSAFLFITILGIQAGNDKPIKTEQLPKEAQLFIKTHFPNHKVAIAKQEIDFLEKSYKVIFTNGSYVSFNYKGVWEEVDCQQQPVPDKIIPSLILTYTKSKFPNQYIVKIDREDRGFEVSLSNDLDLIFNKRYEFVKID